MATRRTQKERSDETRRRLLDATVECLMESGYARTSTTMISKRAGVSRGALLHHYPRKAALVRAAIEHVFQKRVAEFRAAMGRLPEGEDRLAAAIELLWEAYSHDEGFVSSLEFIVAARADPELREEVAAKSARNVGEVTAIFEELFGEATARSPLAAIAPSFGLALMDGLALARLAGKDEAGIRAIIEAAKTVATLVLLHADETPETP